MGPRLVPSQELPLKTRGTLFGHVGRVGRVGRDGRDGRVGHSAILKRQICGWEVWPTGTTLGASWSCVQMVRRNLVVDLVKRGATRLCQLVWCISEAGRGNETSGTCSVDAQWMLSESTLQHDITPVLHPVIFSCL